MGNCSPDALSEMKKEMGNRVSQALFPGLLVFQCLSVPDVFSEDRITGDSEEEPGYHQHRGP